jgi:hypothetical protein
VPINYKPLNSMKKILNLIFNQNQLSEGIKFAQLPPVVGEKKYFGITIINTKQLSLSGKLVVPEDGVALSQTLTDTFIELIVKTADFPATTFKEGENGVWRNDKGIGEENKWGLGYRAVLAYDIYNFPTITEWLKWTVEILHCNNHNGKCFAYVLNSGGSTISSDNFKGVGLGTYKNVFKAALKDLRFRLLESEKEYENFEKVQEYIKANRDYLIETKDRSGLENLEKQLQKELEEFRTKYQQL